MRRFKSSDRHKPALVLKASVLALLLFGVALATIAFVVGAHHGISADVIERIVRSWGAWGVLGSIGLMVVHSLVPFPAELLAITNGMVYGPLWGTVITWTGAMLGAYLAFGLARILGRPFVDLMVSKRNLQTLDEWTSNRGGQFVFISRFMPIIAFNLVNYAAGLTRISWWTFSWATGVGILPMTILMVVMGDRINHMDWRLWLLIVLGGFALCFLIRPLLRSLAGMRIG